MEDDFKRFTFYLEPRPKEDVLHFVMVCLDMESVMESSKKIDEQELCQGGIDYLFGMMKELALNIKKRESFA